MKIRVTREDIDNGEAGDCDRCPVALALLRHTNADEVTVGNCGVDIFHDSGLVVDYGVDLPEVARDFIKKFDTGRDVEPFEFEVDIV